MSRLKAALVSCAFIMGCDGGGTSGVIGTLDLSSNEDAIASDAEPLQDGWSCRPNDTRCMGSIFLKCNSDGSDWIAFQCPPDHKCTHLGCVLLMQDVDSGTENPIPSDYDIPPVYDTAPTADIIYQPDYTGDPTTPEVQYEVLVPVDAVVDTAPEVTGPTTCGKNPPCEEGLVCCARQSGLQCVPVNQCYQPNACVSQTDCPSNQVCCPPQYGPPGGPGVCKDSCGGGGTSMCSSNNECTNGQECVSLFGFGICLTTCDSNADCNGNACKDIGLWGFTIASICECSTDQSCGKGLKCCEIPYVGVKTCLTECVSF